MRATLTQPLQCGWQARSINQKTTCAATTNRKIDMATPLRSASAGLQKSAEAPAQESVAKSWHGNLTSNAWPIDEALATAAWQTVPIHLPRRGSSHKHILSRIGYLARTPFAQDLQLVKLRKQSFRTRFPSKTCQLKL